MMECLCRMCHFTLITLVFLSIDITTVGAQTKCGDVKYDLPHICDHMTLRQSTGLLLTGGMRKNSKCSCRVRPMNASSQDLSISVAPLYPEEGRRLGESTCNLRINIFRHVRHRNGTQCPIFNQKYDINSENPITLEFTHDKSRDQTNYCISYSIPTARVNEVEIVCNNGTVPFEGIANPGEEDDESILQSKAFIIGVSVAGGILLILIIIIIIITCRRKNQKREDCVMTRYEPSAHKERRSPDRGVTVVPLLKYNTTQEHMDHGPVPTPRTTSLATSGKDLAIVPQEDKTFTSQYPYGTYKSIPNDHTEIPIVLASPGRDPADPTGKRMTYLEVDVSQVSPGSIKVKVRGAPPKSEHPQIAYKN